MRWRVSICEGLTFNEDVCVETSEFTNEDAAETYRHSLIDDDNFDMEHYSVWLTQIEDPPSPAIGEIQPDLPGVAPDFFSTFFEVEKRPVYAELYHDTDDGPQPVQAIVPNKVAIVRLTPGVQETPQNVLSIMSREYEPLRDQDAYQRVAEKFQLANIEMIPVKHHVTLSKDGVLGRTTYMEAELPAYSLFPGTDEEQRCRIIIPNSFDGTKALSVLIMFLRLVCLNGMMGWVTDFFTKIKHITGAEDKLTEALNLFMAEKLNQGRQAIEALNNTSGTEELILIYLQNNRILTGERWSEKLVGAWLQAGSPINLWELYNIFTYQITHAYGRNFGSKVQRLEILNHQVKTVWPNVLGANPSFAEQISLNT